MAHLVAFAQHAHQSTIRNAHEMRTTDDIGTYRESRHEDNCNDPVKSPGDSEFPLWWFRCHSCGLVLGVILLSSIVTASRSRVHHVIGAVLATFALGLQVDWLQNHSTTVVAVDEAIFAIFLDVESVIDGAWVKK